MRKWRRGGVCVWVDFMEGRIPLSLPSRDHDTTVSWIQSLVCFSRETYLAFLLEA